ncbi:4-coumarate--CoA ligase 2-like protein [Cladobotryum mycophilum]|uniref:4-coumarate--CoA ligase 2-like protein n=1 Tax=Cladobotryum mycophilum TaxID=491253 RepID=A0ABR0SS64_9HYPO
MAKLSELDRGPAPNLPFNSVWEALQHGYELNPDKTALIAPTQPSDLLQELVGPTASPVDHLTWSFRQIWRATFRLASVFEAHHITSGSTVLLLVPSCAEWTVLMCPTAYKCYTMVPLNTVVLQKENEDRLQGFIERLTPSVVVVSNESEAAVVDRFRNKQNSTFLGLTLDPLSEPLPGWTSIPVIAKLLFPKEIKAEPELDNMERTAWIIHTSGTWSDTPKAVPRPTRFLTHAMLFEVPAIDEPLVLVNTKNHQMMAPWLFFVALRSGNTAVLAGGKDFDPTATLHALATCRQRLTMLFPIMADLLVAHPDFSPDKVDSVMHATVLGSTTTEAVIRKTQQAFPKAIIDPGYAMTEVNAAFRWPPPGPPTPIPTYKGIVSTGIASPGFKFKIVDDSGQIVSRYAPGEVHISGTYVTKGYLHGRPADTFYEENGESWFRIGDCLVVDDQDQIYALGRMDDVIKRNGTIISPGTIQNLLATHYNTSVMVVKAISSDGLELPFSVFAKLDQNPADIEALVLKELGPSYRLGGVLDRQQLGFEQWPVNGKLLVSEIRRAVAKYLAANEAEA